MSHLAGPSPLSARLKDPSAMPRISRRHLPPLGALATFEVAAKHLNFTNAAHELNVTQAAVSQQIRALEDTLDTRLFRRRPKALELTDEGVALLRAVSQGLDIVTSAVSALAEAPAEDPITLAATIGVATHWLSPLIRRYQAQVPETRFAILASDEDTHLAEAPEVDIAFVCGNNRSHAGDELNYLFPEMVQPVCSPAFLAAHGPFDDPARLARTRLLHLHDSHWHSGAINWQPLTWHSWFRSLGADVGPSPAALASNCNPVLIDAACDGEGVILGWKHIVADRLARGDLVAAHPHVLRVERANFLKVNDRARGRGDIRRFVDFVLAESRALMSA